MGLENIEVIDVISIDLSGNVVLTISDDRMWDDDNHLLLLQNKINAYLNVIECGDLIQIYPDSAGRNIVLNIVAKYPPNNAAESFLEQTKNILHSSGYDFNFSVLN